MPVPQTIQDALDKAVSAKSDADAALRDQGSKGDALKAASDAKSVADQLAVNTSTALESALKDLEKAEDDFFKPSVS